MEAKGKWGNNVMPPQSHVSDHNLQLLTNWALTIKDSPHLESWQKEELVTQESNTVLSTDPPLNAKYSLPENRRGTVVRTVQINRSSTAPICPEHLHGQLRWVCPGVSLTPLMQNFVNFSIFGKVGFLILRSLGLGMVVGIRN